MRDTALAVNIGQHGDAKAWAQLEGTRDEGRETRDAGKIKRLAKSIRQRKGRR